MEAWGCRCPPPPLLHGLLHAASQWGWGAAGSLAAEPQRIGSWLFTESPFADPWLDTLASPPGGPKSLALRGECRTKQQCGPRAPHVSSSPAPRPDPALGPDPRSRSQLPGGGIQLIFWGDSSEPMTCVWHHPHIAHREVGHTRLCLEGHRPDQLCAASSEPPSYEAECWKLPAGSGSKAGSRRTPRPLQLLTRPQHPGPPGSVGAPAPWDSGEAGETSTAGLKEVLTLRTSLLPCAPDH